MNGFRPYRWPVTVIILAVLASSLVLVLSGRQDLLPAAIGGSFLAQIWATHRAARPIYEQLDRIEHALRAGERALRTRPSAGRPPSKEG